MHMYVIQFYSLLICHKEKIDVFICTNVIS
jgi:hypothetical protein